LNVSWIHEQTAKRCLLVLGAVSLSMLLTSPSHGEEAGGTVPALSSGAKPSNPSLTAASYASRDDILKQEKIYSGGNEELIVRHFFNDRKNGVFVDVGCWHWHKHSVTAYLEKRLGWSGIAIDALPHFEPGWKKHRPKSKFFQYAVTSKSGEEVTFFAAGMVSSLDPTHISNFKMLKGKVEPRAIKVPTVTLNDLLEKQGVEKVDFMNMDIEGGEPDALMGFDIKKYRPELVCIEAAPNSRKSLSEYFEANDYERIDEYLKYDVINWYYRPKALKASPVPRPTGDRLPASSRLLSNPLRQVGPTTPNVRD